MSDLWAGGYRVQPAALALGFGLIAYLSLLVWLFLKKKARKATSPQKTKTAPVL